MRLRPTIAALLAVLAAACADDGAPAEELLWPATARPALRPVDPAAVPSEETAVVRRLAVPEDVAPWTLSVEGARAELRPIDGPDAPLARAIRLPKPRRGGLTVSIPGDYPPDSFHRVAVRLLGRGSLELRVVMARGGVRAAASTRTLFVPGLTDAQVVVFDVPQMRSRRNALDELRLEVEEISGNWFLGDVDLLSVPFRQWLPRVEVGPALVEVGSEGRRGIGLSSAVPVECDVDAPDVGGRVGFSLGWPLAVRDRGDHGTLRVTLSDGGRAVARQVFPFGRGTTAQPWREHWVDLEPFGGRRLTLRFELASATDGEMLVALSEPHVVQHRPHPVSVLLVTSDTHRADHVRAQGARPELRTPTLDALAARGLLFTNCFSSTNVTVPSHVALLTATHPRDTQVLRNQSLLAEDAPTLAEVLRDEGWLTVAVTSNRTLGRPEAGLGQGFDRTSWPDEAFRDGAGSVSVLERWLPEAEGRPLFCWLHVFDAHTPYLPPAPYDGLYFPRERDARDPALPEPDFPVPRYWEGVRDPDWIRAQYAGEVTYLDAQLGRVLNHPRIRTGIVAVTSDHGESLGQHGVWWDHNGLYPDNVHVPLILSWPALAAPGRVDAPVRQIDVARTLLDLAGVEAEFPGRDLTGDLDPTEPRYALASAGKMASVSLGRWYLLLGLDDRADRLPWKDPGLVYGEVRLYDLARDPRCETDLVDREIDRATRMRALLLAWLESAPPTGWDAGRGIQDEAVLAELAQLGYATGEDDAPALELWDPELAGEWAARFE